MHWHLEDQVIKRDDGSNVAGLVPSRMTAEDRVLVVAAPDLLAALEELTDRVDMVLYAAYVGHDRIKAARRAIDKATGKAVANG